MFADPIREGLSKGWLHIDASQLGRDATLEADVCIIGTGAGGGITADVLSDTGLKVVMIEEGMLKSSTDFRMQETEAYPTLYQESASRKTADKAINILQGRTVGGSTTVNWTSSFRTPSATLKFWRERFGLSQLTDEHMAGWFERAEKLLSISDWAAAPNENNMALQRGGEKIGVKMERIRRNVKGCYNLGYCGMGCPTNAKQSMLLTTIPAALSRGAVLVSRARAERLTMERGRVVALECLGMRGTGYDSNGVKVRVTARHFVVAGGAINSPALLLRSGAPDPHGRLGRRTFLHPSLISGADMGAKVEGWSGAPQTVYSDQFLHTQAIDGPMGYKLEAAPIHPVLYAITVNGMSEHHRARISNMANSQVMIALCRDGFHAESEGGSVKLLADGLPQLDYKLNDYFFDAAKRALLTMAEIQFAAGAKEVFPVDERVSGYRSWAEAKVGLSALDLRPYSTRVASAHVMGGCTMAASERDGVVNGYGRHHQIENLSVIDGSVFPTSIGANPQLSIYGLAWRNAAKLAGGLARR
uniref:Oxidoreductase, GMC family n=1 Tax=uncultured bacterium A1Q1_fos_504 TaxID=1256580 RepID=L7VWH7_9BACT|nr:oxidoreductase, GMC family [uncultured bacterium A1Q1_fos_504]